MAHINTSDLRTGMILANDATGTNGRLLFPKGTTLEEQHLRVLKIWGAVGADIQNISRDDAQNASLEELQPEFLAAAQAYVDTIFHNADHTTFPMEEIYSSCLKFHANRLAMGETLHFDNCNSIPIPVSGTLPRMTLKKFVDNDKGLASFPDIYFKINAALEDPYSTAGRLAEIISKDPSISAKLLSLVNSPFYGFGQRIDSLSRSVALVGANELSQLALGVAVMDLFAGIPDGVVTVQGFWRHSIACGVISRILASHIRDIQQERCFIVGLLHDIGRLVMLKIAPQGIASAIDTARLKRISLREAETITFGFDHTQVAEALFTRWNLPTELIQGVSEHHAAHCPARKEAAVCTVADVLAIGMGYGTTCTIPALIIPSEVWSMLALPEGVLEATLLAASRQIHDIFTIFLK